MIIKKANPSVCHLDLMFIHFDIGSGSCSNDYLSIDGERLCGSIPGGTVKTFTFDLPEKFIFFRGDIGQGVGFNVRGRQVECGPNIGQTTTTSLNRAPVLSFKPSIRSSSDQSSPLLLSLSSSKLSPYDRDEYSSNLPFCDRIFTTESFTLTSPNHPANYPNNLYCQYTIRRPSSSVCAIDVTFVNFDLEESPICSNDYLEIDGSKICGLLPPHHKSRNYFHPSLIIFINEFNYTLLIIFSTFTFSPLIQDDIITSMATTRRRQSSLGQIHRSLKADSH